MKKNKNKKKNNFKNENLCITHETINNPNYIIPMAIKCLERTSKTGFNKKNMSVKKIIGLKKISLVLNDFLNTWNSKGKIRLKFNKSIKSLVDFEKIKDISIIDIFNHLPYKTFFICNNKSTFESNKKDIDKWKCGTIFYFVERYNLYVIIEIEIEKNNLLKNTFVNVTYNHLDMNLDKNKNMKILEFVKDYKQKYDSLDNSDVIELMSNLYYLAAVNADILKEEYKPEVIKINGKEKIINENITTYKIGYESASAIERHKDKSDKTYTYIEGNGSPKRPHIRRSHMHHYWKINKETGEKELIVKFIKETLINCKHTNDLGPITKIVK